MLLRDTLMPQRNCNEYNRDFASTAFNYKEGQLNFKMGFRFVTVTLGLIFLGALASARVERFTEGSWSRLCPRCALTDTGYGVIRTGFALLHRYFSPLPDVRFTDTRIGYPRLDVQNSSRERSSDRSPCEIKQAIPGIIMVEMKTSAIVVTGASGGIGSGVVEGLLRQDISCSSYDWKMLHKFKMLVQHQGLKTCPIERPYLIESQKFTSVAEGLLIGFQYTHFRLICVG